MKKTHNSLLPSHEHAVGKPFNSNFGYFIGGLFATDENTKHLLHVYSWSICMHHNDFNPRCLMPTLLPALVQNTEDSALWPPVTPTSRRRRGDAYIVLLPEELAIISRAEPVLLLEVVHWDGEVGLRGWRGSGQKNHRLLLCVENSRFINPAGLI